MRIVNKEPEAHLIELLNLVHDNRQGWQGVAFAFSRLLEHYRSDYQIKIAMNLINDLLGDRDGAIYVCADADIFVMVRNLPRQLMEKMIFQLRYLFMDDPLAYQADGEENPLFCTLYEIETDWDAFMDLCKRRLVKRVRQTHAEQRPIPAAANAAMAAAGIAPIQFPRAEMRYFTATSLAALEGTLKDVEITSAIRRQPVVASMKDGSVRTIERGRGAPIFCRFKPSSTPC